MVAAEEERLKEREAASKQRQSAEHKKEDKKEDKKDDKKKEKQAN